MRSLTPAEARVIRALLASVPGDESQRAFASGVPRTTYQTIRRRVLRSGWVQERYLPAPEALGAQRLTFRLDQPFAEHRADVIRALRTRPTVALLWASPESIFSIAFTSSSPPTSPGIEATDRMPSEWLRRSWVVAAAPRRESIPVYFDYEGAWARRTDSGRSTSYPQSIPSGPVGGPKPRVPELRSLLGRPFETHPEDGFIVRYSAIHLPRRERRLVELGWVAHRAFPNLSEIPTFRGERDERVVFVTGLRVGGEDPDAFQQRIHREGSISPFLVVGDDERLLMALLSPAPSHIGRRTRPTLQLLRSGLREIEIVREPLDTLFPILDHRYDRLLPPDPT